MCNTTNDLEKKRQVLGKWLLIHLYPATQKTVMRAYNTSLSFSMPGKSADIFVDAQNMTYF